jgi:hypothetical protein
MMLEPVPAIVIGAWALVGLVVVAFIVRFRTDWREGVKAGAALVAAAVALGCFISYARHRAGGDDYRFKIQGLPSQPDATLEVRCGREAP